MGVGDPDCSSLLDEESSPDHGGPTSPQWNGPRRSPRLTRAGSPRSGRSSSRSPRPRSPQQHYPAGRLRLLQLILGQPQIPSSNCWRCVCSRTCCSQVSSWDQGFSPWFSKVTV